MDMNTQDKDIMVNMANAGNFTKLNNAMKAAGLVTNYKGIGPFTLFAPTDAAFDKLPKGKLESLLRDKAALQSVINLQQTLGGFGLPFFSLQGSSPAQEIDDDDD